MTSKQRRGRRSEAKSVDINERQTKVWLLFFFGQLSPQGATHNDTGVERRQMGRTRMGLKEESEDERKERGWLELDRMSEILQRESERDRVRERERETERDDEKVREIETEAKRDPDSQTETEIQREVRETETERQIDR